MRELHAKFVWRGVLFVRMWSCRMDVLKSRHRPQAKRMQADPLQVKRVQAAPPRVKQKPRSKSFGDLLVAPTGVDPVTFRFSVERSTN